MKENKFDYGICDACNSEDFLELVYLDEELKEARWFCRNCIIKAHNFIFD